MLIKAIIFFIAIPLVILYCMFSIIHTSDYIKNGEANTTLESVFKMNVLNVIFSLSLIIYYLLLL